MESAGVLKSAFETVQVLSEEGILMSYHDVSDGGLMVSIMEMAFAGNCGVDIQVSSPRPSFTPPMVQGARWPVLPCKFLLPCERYGPSCFL